MGRTNRIEGAILLACYVGCMDCLIRMGSCLEIFSPSIPESWLVVVSVFHGNIKWQKK